jgi:hypothetical protein
MGPPPPVLRSDTPLLKTVNEIVESEYVLIRDERTNAICGYITPADLSIELHRQGEPFLILREIEYHLRALILGGEFTQHDIREAKDARDKDRTVEGVDDLTFGECLYLLKGSSTASDFHH